MSVMRHRLSAIAAAAALASAASAQTPPATGEQLYIDNCSACHQADGSGVKGAFPALAGDPFVQGDRGALAGVVLKGRGGMPTFKDDLNDADLAAILTYIRASWGAKASAITPDVVAAVRGKISASAERGLQAH